MKEDLKQAHATGGNKRLASAFLLVTALLCGATVMVVEILGSRVIGPFFGAGRGAGDKYMGKSGSGYLHDRFGSPDTEGSFQNC